MNRKYIITALILCLPLSMSFATTYDEIMASAKERSLTLKNSELQYRNEMIAINASEREDKPVWNVESSVSPYSESGDDKDFIVSSLKTSVVLPNDGDTTITLSSPLTIGYSDGYVTASPSLSASHSFNFNAYDQDILDDLNDAKNHLVTESTYAKAVLSFESLVISYMKQFIAIEKQIFIAEKNLDDKTTVMDNYLKLRTATEDSLTYQKAVLDVQKARMDLDSLNQQKSLLKTQYKTVTGLDWDGLTDIPDPVLDLVPLAEGNTSVLVSSLSAQIADETVKKEESALNPQSLRLTGTLGVDVNNKLRGTRNPVNGTVSYTENMATGTVGLTYVGSNWSIGGTFGASTNGSFDIKPKLTIAGSWTSDSNSDEDNDKLQTLRNNALISRNTYSNDLLAYNNEALQYSTEISSYMFQVEQLKSNMDYYAKLLEFEKESFDKGLSSQSDLDNAQYNYDLLKYDEATTKLDGLDLENRIKTFAI